ncbi:hypothetical protein BJF85_20820 [Saccharomonospora sp. CUA-673]|nr:hypothetical protein BJF85_20820 [Saccharomonospora sp. CUA-673]
MLRRVARELAVDGWRVVLPSRRYAPIPAGQPDQHSVRWASGNRQMSVGSGKAIWVEAHWDQPGELARKAGLVLDDLGGPADLLVAWLHEAYRSAVLAAVSPLLADDAPVVEVSAVPESGDAADVAVPPDPFCPERRTQQVLLGATSDVSLRRPLGHEEIERGVLDGVRRALDGRPTSVHQLGERRPVAGY